ncbi:membrane protein insertion efficiency factor YidD [Corynebacterium sp. H128]|uniref:membrane protein insertion efficiency factor YidD n=1 Tax=unclassified Corynebacterium TaxID=2624378 RepID=UPI0030A4C71F
MCPTHSPNSPEPSRRSPANRALFQLVLLYQKYISPLKMGSTCRFEPTCSAYALDALREHGAVKATLLTAVRLAKCGPWHPGGFDPVRPRKT